MSEIKTIEWKDKELVIIDCTKLPLNEEYVHITDYRRLIEAIKMLRVRGAPAIGVAASFGVVLAALEAVKNKKSGKEFQLFLKEACREIAGARPTAVNLSWSVKRMEHVISKNSILTEKELVERLTKEALNIFAEDIECNRNIGKNGAEVVLYGASILTHCNAGALATAGFGTALGVIRQAYRDGKNIKVFADETRPLLQGARLTAWELQKEGIPTTLITDNMAGYAMKLGKINMVIIGADRIAKNGDTANKIGSYQVAVLAKEHNVPFYVAAPLSTIDINISSGDEINIEERDKDEVRNFYGVRTAPNDIDVFNPAFDVTPARYIKGIITELGVLKPPFELSIQEAFKRGVKN